MIMLHFAFRWRLCGDIGHGTQTSLNQVVPRTISTRREADVRARQSPQDMLRRNWSRKHQEIFWPAMSWALLWRRYHRYGS